MKNCQTLKTVEGLPWWLGHKESGSQCRRPGIADLTCFRAAKPVLERPCSTTERSPLTTTRESPCSNKDPVQPKINKLIKKNRDLRNEQLYIHHSDATVTTILMLASLLPLFVWNRLKQILDVMLFLSLSTSVCIHFGFFVCLFFYWIKKFYSFTLTE